MQYQEILMPKKKKIAIVAHDHKKSEIVEWAKRHREELAKHDLCATGTTGALIEKETKLPIQKLRSGPLGGDLEIGAMITEGEIDCLVFFWDPLAAQPHDPDVRALLRIAIVWNILVVSNTASADFLFSSPYMNSEYKRFVPDYDEQKRKDWPLKGG